MDIEKNKRRIQIKRMLHIMRLHKNIFKKCTLAEID